MMKVQIDTTDKAKKKYFKSKKGKEALKKYRESGKGKEAQERYQNSELGMQARLRYYYSEKGTKVRRSQQEMQKLLRRYASYLEDNPGKTIEDFLKDE